MLERSTYFSRFFHPIAVSFVYLLLYLPILVVVIFSFNDSASSVGWVGFSLRWYKELFNNSEILEALKTSLIVAFASTLISVFIGTMLVIASTWKRREALFNLFYLNVVIPDIIIALGTLTIFTFMQIPTGYNSIIVGHTLIGLGFVIPIMRARFSELDPVLTEASLDLGATYFQTFKLVILPLLFPSIIASSLLVFTLSLDDFLIAFFCSSASVQTLSVYVYSVAKSGINPLINAVSTLLLVASSIVVLLLCFFKVFDQVISYD